MRRLPLPLIPLVALALVGADRCASEGSTTPAATGALTGTHAAVVVPGTVVLALGESALVEGRGVALRFARVVEDSRCPREVVCVWAGRARVGLELARDGDAARAVELEIASPPVPVEAEGLRLSAEALDPYPSADEPTRPEQYRLTLRVEAAGG